MQVPVDLGSGHTGTLELTLTLTGHAPCWADPGEGSLPVRIVRDDETIWCGHLDVRIPGVRAAMLLDDDTTEPTRAIAELVAARARREAWRLLSQPAAEPGDEPALIRLSRRMAASHVHPHFVDGPDEDRPLLVPALPASWGKTGEALLDLPLIPTSDGPRSVRAFAQIQGTDECWTLTSSGEDGSIRGIEDRLGHGHLAHPGASPILFMLARLSHGWSPWSPGDLNSPTVRAALVMTRTVALPATLDGWVVGQSPVPGIALLTRGQAPAPVDLDSAIQTLVHHLQELHDEDRWADAVRPEDAGACRAMGRLALLHAAAAAGTLDTAPLLRPSDGSNWTSAAALRAASDGAIAPRHGPRIAERHTALVTYDELCIVGEHAPPLRFDDAPDVWRSLAGDSPERWLLRQPVSIPGLEGWLGLRIPFDPTSGVLVQGSGAVVALSGLDRRLPCHGLLWLDGGRAAPTRQQVELLRLARQELYHALSEIVLRGGEGPIWDAACQYAVRYVRVASADTTTSLQGTPLTLARRLRITWPDGRDFGTLAAWLATSEDARPPLQPVPGQRAPHAQAKDAAQDRALTDEVSRRLSDALGWSRNGVRVRWWDQGYRSPGLVQLDHSTARLGRVDIWLNREHPVAARLSSDSREAIELILMACALRIADWEPARQSGITLPQMQQVLVAQRLSGSIDS